MTTFRERLKAALAEHGAMHCHELAPILGLPAAQIQARIGKLRANHPGEVRIATYRREECRGKLYPRACYGLGSAPDAKRPPPLPRSEYNRRFRQSVTHQVSSVWALAVPREARRRVASMVQGGRSA